MVSVWAEAETAQLIEPIFITYPSAVCLNLSSANCRSPRRNGLVINVMVAYEDEGAEGDMYTNLQNTRKIYGSCPQFHLTLIEKCPTLP
jgi:hypothetical protein